MYQSTLSGVTRIYQNTQDNFFKTTNNLIQNISNIGFDLERNVPRDFRAAQKDIVTWLKELTLAQSLS